MIIQRHRARRPCERKAEFELVLVSHGTLKIAGNWPETKKRHGRILLQVSEGVWTCWHLDFRIPASRTVRQISVVSATNLWYFVMVDLGN